MWTWNVDKVNCIHKLKQVEDLHVFLKIAIFLVEKDVKSISEIAAKLGLSQSSMKEYILQGRVCLGEGGWCSANDCLGRFSIWFDYQSLLEPTKRCSELLEDYHNELFEAGMLKICLKTVPHFLEFCEILSRGAHITQKYGEYLFKIFQKNKKTVSLDEWQLRRYVYERIRKRFGKGVSIPHEELDQLIVWSKHLEIIRRNPTFGWLEFNVKRFERYLDRKHIYEELSEDRDAMETLI